MNKPIFEGISSLYRDEIQKSLVAKKVQVKRKDGSTYWATRMVNPDTGQAEDHSSKHKKYVSEEQTTGGSEEEKIQSVIDSDASALDKVRHLAGLGVYNREDLAELSGHKYPSDAVNAIKKEIGVDVKEFSINSKLPTRTSQSDGEHSGLEDGGRAMMAVSEIATELGDKKAYEEIKRRKQEIIEKYGITVDDKWDSYSDNIEMLLDGTLGLKSIMGYGTGGVGKTFSLEKSLQERKMIEYDDELDMDKGGEEYDYVKIGGKIGSKEVQKLLYNHSNKLVIFDDCDSMWNDDGLINVLKNALDTSGSGKMQWAAPQKDGDEIIPTSYRFTGKMIFITNLSKEQLKAKGAAAIAESRCASTDLTMNLQQTLDKLQSIRQFIKVKNYDTGEEIPDVQDSDKEMALNALTEVAPHGTIDQINTRVLIGIIAKARLLRRKGMEADAIHANLCKAALQQFGY